MIRRIRPSLAIRIFGPSIPAIRQKEASAHLHSEKTAIFAAGTIPERNKMDWFTDLFTQHSAIQAVVVLSLISVFGMMLGKVRFFGISLGVTFVFFIGIAAGHFGLSVDPSMLAFAESFGLVLFVYALGLQVYARGREKETGKNFRFTLTTNGMLIDDDVIDFANRECSNVVLSLDGRREVHDRYRVDYAGNGSWERIVPKFQKLVEARGGKNYYMRGTFTHANPDFLNDIKEMLSLGFRELSMEPVVTSPDDPSALTEEDLPTVLRQYEELAELMQEKRREGDPFTFYHYMIDLKDGPCIYKRVSGCGSGTEYMAVTPWGDLYPCHQFVGDEKFRLGDVWHGVDNKAIQDEFESCNVYARPECRSCWAKLYCSGGCAANAYHASGSVTGIYEYGCKLFKKRMECAIMLEASKAVEGS